MINIVYIISNCQNKGKEMSPTTAKADTLAMPVRMPLTLYNDIGEAADLSGWSRNKEAVRRLERSFARDSTLAELLIEGLGIEKHQRITSTTEENDVRRLFLFLENIPIDRIYLGAREDSAFGGVVIILIQSGALTLCMDHAHFNVATDHSRHILMDLFANIERLGFKGIINVAEAYLPDTRDMNDFEAIDCYLSHVPFRKRGSIKKLLALLGK